MENLLHNPYFGKIMFTLVALIGLFVASLILKKTSNLIFGKVDRRIQNDLVLARTRTIRSLLYNIIDVVLFVMVVLIIMSNWGINIVPLLTGAGLVGLAVSFGAQTLVKDLIAGFFIILENQFSIGDKVKIDKFEGTVYMVTLRLTVLKDNKDNLIYIPNSQVLSVIRYNSKPQIAN